MPVAERHKLAAELRVELSSGHQLRGLTVTPVARCMGCDDVVFCVEDDPAYWIQVHLTWRGQPEPPSWPWFRKVDLPLSQSLADHDEH